MVNVIKQEVRMEESLRKRLEFICEFCRVKPIIINDCKKSYSTFSSQALGVCLFELFN